MVQRLDEYYRYIKISLWLLGIILYFIDTIKQKIKNTLLFYQYPFALSDPQVLPLPKQSFIIIII
jgi:hypothetical protein